MLRWAAIFFFTVCGALLACRDASTPSNANAADGGAGSMTPPGDYMSTGRSGLGEPVTNVGTDGGNLPSVYDDKEKRGAR